MEKMTTSSARAPWCCRSGERRHRPDHPGALPEGDQAGLRRTCCSPTGGSTPRVGPSPDFVLNRPEAAGCRSWSRATTSAAAPRASTRRGRSTTYGFRAVDQHLDRGHLPQQRAEKQPGAGAWIDAQCTRGCWRNRAARSRSMSRPATLTLPGGTKRQFPIDPFARYCLLNGVDELEYLLSQLPAIEARECRLQAAVHPR